MVLRKLVGLLTCTLILGSSFAMAGVPDLEESTAAIATTGVDLVLYNRLDGTGSGFEYAKDATGAVHNAVITLTVLDSAGVPVAIYPFEDMWLVSQNGGLVACPNGTTADASTDVDGVTEWRNPLAAGGWSDLGTLELCQVVINGDALTSATGINLFFNSADMDGNLDVGLTDLTFFTGVYYGTTAYNIGADLDYNNSVGLTDLTVFTGAYYGDGGCQ